MVRGTSRKCLRRKGAEPKPRFLPDEQQGLCIRRAQTDDCYEGERSVQGYNAAARICGYMGEQRIRSCGVSKKVGTKLAGGDED